VSFKKPEIFISENFRFVPFRGNYYPLNSYGIVCVSVWKAENYPLRFEAGMLLIHYRFGVCVALV
jgi:hypothetical protein